MKQEYPIYSFRDFGLDEWRFFEAIINLYKKKPEYFFQDRDLIFIIFCLGK